jgi:hypothetical protein
VATNALTLDKAQATMVVEANTAKLVQIFIGRVLKNEVGADIVRRTYQLERQLGKADTTDTYNQAEYVTGAVPDELTLTVATADKIMVDMSFVGMDHELVDGATGPKAGERVTLPESDVYNTVDDPTRIKLAVYSATNEFPTPLFAFASELTLVIKNGVTPNKAIGVLGAFEASTGNFNVSGNITAYFANIAAVQAVRDNSNVTLDLFLAKNNVGIAIDVPLVTLGNGRLNVEQDKPIMIPLSNEAASGETIDADMDHTLLMVFFDYLPDAAM